MASSEKQRVYYQSFVNCSFNNGHGFSPHFIFIYIKKSIVIFNQTLPETGPILSNLHFMMWNSSDNEFYFYSCRHVIGWIRHIALMLCLNYYTDISLVDVISVRTGCRYVFKSRLLSGVYNNGGQYFHHPLHQTWLVWERLMNMLIGQHPLNAMPSLSHHGNNCSNIFIALCIIFANHTFIMHNGYILNGI